MELNYKKMIKALNAIESERHIPESVIIEALEEAMAKAYKKDAELADINVISKINEKTGSIDIFQIYVVSEEIEDDELEISLEEARKIDPLVELGGEVMRKVEITTMSRAAAGLARNVMRQKIREAEKETIYAAFIDKLYDMETAKIESVKEKFTLVTLGDTVAMMPRSSEIPGEELVEGENLRVVITEVNRETRGSQILVSRADPMLVKRLFEKEVPEIANGVVEIKAIARDAGERTKMAVISYNKDVDPIGACIGPSGQRVQEIINELHGEKIDIFRWSDDLTELVKNSLAPAEVQAVLPGDDEKSLIVVVDENQLSLAIGKKGKNARLAVKLTDHKIDIKTREELEKQGRDYEAMLEAAKALKKTPVESMDLEPEVVDEAQLELDAKRIEEAKEKVKQAVQEETEAGFIPEEMVESVSDMVDADLAMEDVAEEEQAPVEEVKETVEVEEETSPVEDVQAPKLNLEELAPKTEEKYVSKFEKLVGGETAPKQTERPKYKKRRNFDEPVGVINNKELEEKLRKKIDPELMPTYSEEEIEELEAQMEEEEMSQYDIDYDEYEDFYLEEEQGK